MSRVGPTARVRAVACGARALAVALFTASMLAGCAQTTVIRDPGSHRKLPPSRNASRPKPPPRAGSTATVRKGDTLYRIAVTHGISPLDLATWNRIPPPYTIYPGQRLRLTAPSVAARPPAPPAGGVKPPTTPGTGNPGTGGVATTTPSAATPTTGTAPRPTTGTGTTPRPPVAPTPPAGPVATDWAWRWPADGGVIARYVAGDPTRQGIGIGGASGAPVRAAADGVVVYSGAGLIGYGELIIIKHDERWLSAYGHNRARLVNEGQRVKAGEQIAELGRSGAARDMLHFEIRHNGKPVDPQLYLPKR